MLFRWLIWLIPGALTLSFFLLALTEFDIAIVASLVMLLALVICIALMSWGHRYKIIVILLVIIVTGLVCGLAKLALERFSYWDDLSSEDLYWQGKVVDVPRNVFFGYQVKIELECVGRNKNKCDQYQTGRIWPVYVLINSDKSWRPRPGQRWQFFGSVAAVGTDVLPWGFDRRRWMLANHIVANVKWDKSFQPILLSSPAFSINELRFQLSEYLGEKGRLAGKDGWVISAYPVLLALLNGDRSLMGPEHWRLFNATGTTHLVAISGMHIGLVAGFVGFVGFHGLRRRVRLTLATPARYYAVFIALVAAVFYGALAGFSLPTQRALIMLMVYGVGLMLGGVRGLWSALSIAFLVVVLWDPASVLSMGLWLSFGAVFLILWLVGARPIASRKWLQWGEIQLGLFLGLIPILLWQTQAFSLVSPVTNLIAIPWVTCVVVPLALVWFVAWWILGSSADILLELVLYSIRGLIGFLDYFGQLNWASWWGRVDSGVAVLLAMVGAIWMLTPGLPSRWLAPVLFFPLFIMPSFNNGVYLWAENTSPWLIVHQPNKTIIVAKSYWPKIIPPWQEQLLRYWGIGFNERRLQLQSTGALWSAKSWVMVELDHDMDRLKQRRVTKIQFTDLCDPGTPNKLVGPASLALNIYRHPTYSRHCAVKVTYQQQCWMLWPTTSIRSQAYLLKRHKAQLSCDHLLLVPARSQVFDTGIINQQLTGTEFITVGELTVPLREVVETQGLQLTLMARGQYRFYGDEPQSLE